MARFRTMTVTHKTIAAVRKLEVLHRLEEAASSSIACASSRRLQIARYPSVDRRCYLAGEAEKHCYGRSWRVALLERFWQAAHPPRYAAYLIPSSPRSAAARVV